MQKDWEELSEEEQDFELKAQRSLSYMNLLHSSHKTLTNREAEFSRIISGTVVVALVLFGLWLWHEDAWEAKLERALDGCIVPMSDGSCARWDLNALAERQNHD